MPLRFIAGCKGKGATKRDESLSSRRLTRSQMEAEPLQTAEDLFSVAARLLKKHWDGHPVRLLGVAALHVFDRAGAVKQLDLFHYEEEVKRNG
ncbi:hypothetical protein [Geobacillus sp. C56-T2]|uniref:DinB/UmuC family translesion DNA polymerase n=1 Tax=Geobacillus sp. C56-T2 TaxID=600773 RepID=UPI002105E3A7|nr:hypothetical protein [Geobacillus sp. C56-T2]